MQTLFAVLGWLLSIVGIALAAFTLLSGTGGEGPDLAIASGGAAAFLIFALAVNPLARRVGLLRPLWRRSVLAVLMMIIGVLAYFVVSTNNLHRTALRLEEMAPSEWTLWINERGEQVIEFEGPSFALVCRPGSSDVRIQLGFGSIFGYWIQTPEGRAWRAQHPPGSTFRVYAQSDETVETLTFTGEASDEVSALRGLSDWAHATLPRRGLVEQRLRAAEQVIMYPAVGDDNWRLYFGSRGGGGDRAQFKTFFDVCDGLRQPIEVRPSQ